MKFIFNLSLQKSVVVFFLLVLLILIGYVIAKFSYKIINIFLKTIKIDDLLKKLDINISFSIYFSYFIELIIYLFFIIKAMDEISLNLAPYVFDILGIIILIVVFISILFTIKDFFPNLYASYNINKNIKIGSLIKCNGVEGYVQTIGLIETIIKSKNGDFVYIPNSYLMNSIIIKSK